MKKIFTLFSFSLILFHARAQTEYLCTVNNSTGSFSNINDLPGVMWISVPNLSSFDENNHRYFFKGGPDLVNWYLYTVDAITGNILSQPSFPKSNGISAFIYGKTTNILYGFQKFGSLANFVSININTGTLTVINTIPHLSSINSVAFNNNRNEIYIAGTNKAGGFAFFKIDAVNGNVLLETSFYNLGDIQYDNSADKLYGLLFGSPLQLARIDTATGVYTSVGVISNVTGVLSLTSTFDNDNHRYFFQGAENTDNYLYTIDATNAHIIYKAPAIVSGVGNHDNIAEHKYDNTSGILYALHWEAVTLPITLISFTATKQVNSVLLYWKTSSEINNAGFYIERSTNNNNFSSLGYAATKGNGAVCNNSYSFTDKTPLKGNNFYRLKQVDKDGKFTYSKIASAEFIANALIKISPNPVHSVLHVEGLNAVESYELRVMSESGLVVQQVSVKNIFSYELDVSKLANGIYFLQAGEERVKFVKE